MDKIEKVLDVIDHSEKYSDEEIRELLQDEECRKLYQTMQEVDSVLLRQEMKGADGETSDGVDVDAEWERFSERHHLLDEASAKDARFSWRKIAASVAGFLLVSGLALAAIHTFVRKGREPMPVEERAEERVVGDGAERDTAKATLPAEVKAEKPAVHKTFENVAFGQMMTEIAAYYDLQVKFEDDETKSLRLYYEWDSHRKIEDVIKELNQFDKVNILLENHEVVVR